MVRPFGSWLRAAAVALVASPLGLLALGSSNQACTKGETFATAPPIVIGATVDLTKQKDFGAGAQRVLRVAETHFNAMGGILGRRLVLDVRDDAGDTSRIAGVAADFIKIGAAGFVGPSTTDALVQVHDTFRQAGIPVLSPFTTSPTARTIEQGKDRYVFRTSCAAEAQARAIARYALAGSFAPPTNVPIPDAGSGPTDSGVKDASSDAAKEGGTTPPDAGSPQTGFKACRKMAVIYAEDAPGQGSTTIDALKAEYGKYGGVITDFIIQPSAATYAGDVAKVVTAAKAGDVECQTMLMFPADGGKYMREFRNATSGDPSFTATAFPGYGFIRYYQTGFIQAGRVDPTNVNEISSVEGVMGAACNQERATSPEWNRFMTLYDSEWPPTIDAGNQPAPIPQVYDSVVVLALAIEKVGRLDDRVAIRDAIYDVSRPPGEAFGPGQLAEALEALRNGRDIDYVGASGTFDIGDDGDAALEVIMFRVAGNGFDTIPGLRSEDLQQ